MSCHTEALKTLQAQGMRLTAQRAVILEDLFHQRGHRTAEAIYNNVKPRLPGLNLATVYRTLEMLHAARVIAAFDGRDGLTEYELVAPHDGHHHLLCRECGAELDLAAAPIERLRTEICAQFGFEADLEHLIITGLCQTCRQKSAGASAS
ncbi:MAG TPA: Fur family transcriptional regulator [Anaerolineae bacterium]